MKMILHKMTLFIFFTVFLVSVDNIYSDQAVFAISGIDATKFDTVKASFVALTSGGTNYSGLSKSDFVVIDNGIDVTSSVVVDCHDSIAQKDLSIILVLDQSQSMNTPYEDGSKRWDWVKQGATSFINLIDITGQTKIGMISFAKRAWVRCPFTQNRQRLLDSLDKIQPAGGTLYEPPFLEALGVNNNDGGAVPMFQAFSPDSIRRIVVFLTDGQPEQTPDVEAIKAGLLGANVQVYAITVAMPMNQELATIAVATGGGAYSVNSKTELNDIYKLIAFDIQKKQFCSLTWFAPFGCTEASRQRLVHVTFKPQQTTTDRIYDAPLTSIASVELSPDVVIYGDPNPNTPTPMNVKLTARVTDFVCNGNNINPGPNTYYKVTDWDVPNKVTTFSPFTIKKDESRTIEVQFTQDNSRQYRPASLVFLGTPCPPTVSLIGGITQIKIVSPNGGEILSSCDPVIIKWAGILPDKQVDLSYSTDDGATWLPLANNVTGLRYSWQPPKQGVKYRIRGVVSPVSQYLWAYRDGDANYETAVSLALTNDGNYFYITGCFRGKFTIGTQTFTSLGNSSDIYVAKYNSDGALLWARTAGSASDDSATAVCVDESDNVYITGTCYNGITFSSPLGSQTLNLPVDGVPYCFVARYDKLGNSPNVVTLGATASYFSTKAGGTKIRYGNADSTLDVIGKYTANSGFSIPSIPLTLTKAPIPTDFTAKIKFMNILYVTQGANVYSDISKDYAYDAKGVKYSCGSFINNITFGTYKLVSKGNLDIFINKFGGTPGSEDINDSAFAILSPAFSFNKTLADFGNTTLGNSNSINYQRIVSNTGSIPITITNAKIEGVNQTDFKLVSNPVSTILMPGDSLDIELVFLPSDIGVRKGILVLTDTCAGDIFLDLTGYGICSGLSITPVDFAKIAVGTSKPLTIQGLFQNTNTSLVEVIPEISGTNAADFDINTAPVYVNPNSSQTWTITFTPKGPGLRTASLTFKLPTGCENPVTDLLGYGVETALTIPDVDWGDRRILTVNDSFIVITNKSVLPAVIDSIKFETLPETSFKFGSITTPFSIDSSQSDSVKITFTPQLEQSYSNIVDIFAQSNSTPLKVVISGKGVLPKYSSTWTCDTATKPGSSSIAFLEIQNPSTSAPLSIDSMVFTVINKEFDWLGGIVPRNKVISPTAKMLFPVVFSPLGTGTRSNLITITCDAAPGPDKNPKVFQKVDVLCDGLGLTVKDSVDFGGTLICSDNTQKLNLENTSWKTDITIAQAKLSGADVPAFTVDLPPNFVIKAGNFNVLSIKFSPTEAKKYTAVLTLTTSDGDIITVNLLGTGEALTLYSDTKSIVQYIGYDQDVHLFMKVNKLTSKTVDNIKLLVTYDTKMLLFKSIVFNNIAGWTGSSKSISTGVFEIDGTGSIQTPFDGQLATMKYTIFLGDQTNTDLKVKPVMGNCVTIDTAISNVSYKPFCFENGRLIVLSSTAYSLSTPEPNPANNEFKLKAGVGLDAQTAIEIFSTMGQKVYTIISQELKSGVYEFIIPTEDIPSGNYLIRMQSGPYIQAEKLIIMK